MEISTRMPLTAGYPLFSKSFLIKKSTTLTPRGHLCRGSLDAAQPRPVANRTPYSGYFDDAGRMTAPHRV